MYSKIYKSITVLPIILIMIFSSCREEIIMPNNPVGNTNNPVKNSSYNNYTFAIEAENISYKIIDLTKFSSGSTRIFFKITNYKSGYLVLRLLNEKYQSLYSTLLDQNYDGNYISVDNVIPYYVELSFTNFSGNLRVELHRYL